MASPTLDAFLRSAPPGFQWVLVCNQCTYCFCFECLAQKIKDSPASLYILQEWLNKYGLNSYRPYFRNRRDLFCGIISGGPFRGQVYICIYTPYLTYTDYCMIMHQVKYDGSIWITFECDGFKDHYYSWSGWLYLLMWQYCPRDEDFFNQTDRDAFKIWFHAEVCEAVQHEAWFVFNLTYETCDLLEDASCSTNKRYFIKSHFFGKTCVPQDELISSMMGSPFFESFSLLSPFSTDHSSPPSDHAASFDSMEEYNLDNRMEA